MFRFWWMLGVFFRNLRYFQIFLPPSLFPSLIYSLLSTSSSSLVKFRGKLTNEKFITRDDLSAKSWHYQYAIKSSLKISCKSLHTSIRILLEIVNTQIHKHFFRWSFKQIFLKDNKMLLLKAKIRNVLKRTHVISINL